MPKAPSHIPTCGNTEVVTLEYCTECRRITMRLVFEGDRLGPCMGCHPDFSTKKQLAAKARHEREAQNPTLF